MVSVEESPCDNDDVTHSDFLARARRRSALVGVEEALKEERRRLILTRSIYQLCLHSLLSLGRRTKTLVIFLISRLAS